MPRNSIYYPPFYNNYDKNFSFPLAVKLAFIILKLLFFPVILIANAKRPMAMADIRNQVFTFPWLLGQVAGS